MILIEWKGVHSYPHGSVPFSVPDLEKVSQMVGQLFSNGNHISISNTQPTTRK